MKHRMGRPVPCTLVNQHLKAQGRAPQTSSWESFPRSGQRVARRPHSAGRLAAGVDGGGVLSRRSARPPCCLATPTSSGRRSRRRSTMPNAISRCGTVLGRDVDARVKTREGALAGFRAFLAVYELTRGMRFRLGGPRPDVAPTYTVKRTSTCRRAPARSRAQDLGWTMCRRNQHLTSMRFCSRRRSGG